MYRAQSFSAGSARSAIFVASPYYADQFAMLIGLGYSVSAIIDKLNVIARYATVALPSFGTGGVSVRDLTMILYRLQKYYPIKHAVENAHDLAEHCGEHASYTHRILDELYTAQSAPEIAEKMGARVEVIKNISSGLMRRTGSVSRSNMLVRLSGLSRDEWMQPMDTEGVSPWANLT